MGQKIKIKFQFQLQLTQSSRGNRPMKPLLVLLEIAKIGKCIKIPYVNIAIFSLNEIKETNWNAIFVFFLFILVIRKQT